MQTSREEALALLKKWYSERTPIGALLRFPDTEIAAKIRGFINGLSEDILISDGTTSPQDRPRNYILVPAHLTTSYEYVEAKDIPILGEYFAARHGTSNLRITLSSGAIVSLFEIAD
jgi:hypothetical protein